MSGRVPSTRQSPHLLTDSLAHRLKMHHGSTAHDISIDGFELSLANQQSLHAVDEPRLLAAARGVLEDSRFTSAAVSLAVVDDPAIHALNRRFLNHDFPTDVLSFVLDEQNGHLEGEVIISADTAAAAAVEWGWSAADEQLLYVIHGMLHLVGYRDKIPADAARMRSAEQRHLRRYGVLLPADGAAAPSRDGPSCARVSKPRSVGGTVGGPAATAPSTTIELNHISQSNGGTGTP
jgi:probable rRNA maturation factor